MRIAIIGVGGAGDCLLSRQCGFYAERLGHKISYFYPVRDEVFKPLKHFFPDSIQISTDFDEGNNFEKDVFYRSKFDIEYGPFDEVYWVVPDLLYCNNHSFEWLRYNVHPQTIKQTRLLTHVWTPDYSDPLIYVALATSTPNYNYPYLRQLLIDLAGTLRTHIIYFPNISQWAGKDLNFGDLSNLPNNVWIDNDPDIIDSLEILRRSEYCISTCNGSSHWAFHFGIPRLILDPQFERPAWVARWKENEAECIDRLTDPGTVARIVKTNIEMPQTCLIDRRYLLNDVDWARVLMLKKY